MILSYKPATLNRPLIKRVFKQFYPLFTPPYNIIKKKILKSDKKPHLIGFLF